MSAPIDVRSTPGPVQTEGDRTYRIDTVHYRGRHVDRRVYVAQLGTEQSPEFDRPEDAASWARKHPPPKRLL